MRARMADHDGATDGRDAAAGLYERLEDRILARDQVGASEAYYDLCRAGRPLTEMVSEAVRIHAPYTHVPYHERIDDGFVNFVNNDHCLLSARATLHLSKLLPTALSGLPMAQTIWYIPTGLDIWNQKILKAPGHYARKPGFTMPPGPPPAPEVFWPDQQPERLDAPLQQQLDHWMTLVHRGQVLEAYRVFLGIMVTPEHRKAALAQLVFAGLIDVQDRSVLNRSYTTGHKSFRARATVEVGTALGWDNAHQVLYAGALDIAVGPRWYSTYEMACNAVTVFIENQTLSAIPYAGTTERERALLANTQKLSAEEGEALLTAIFEQPEPDYLKAMTDLMLAGRSPRRILDALQLGAARVVLETRHPNGFSLPQHCYEYMNTMGWFWDNFEHPHKIKLLYLAASYLKQACWHQRHTNDSHPIERGAPAGADKLSAAQLLGRVDEAVLALDGPASVAWTQAYLDMGGDRGALVQRLALLACRMGNDPHNQEIAQNLIEDSRRNQGWDVDRLLLACAHHTAAHRKYGDPLDCSRRFGTALGLTALQ